MLNSNGNQSLIHPRLLKKTSENFSNPRNPPPLVISDVCPCPMDTSDTDSSAMDMDVSSDDNKSQYFKATSELIRCHFPDNGNITFFQYLSHKEKKMSESFVNELKKHIYDINEKSPEKHKIIEGEISFIIDKIHDYQEKDFKFKPTLFSKLPDAENPLQRRNHGIIFYINEKNNLCIMFKPLVKNNEKDNKYDSFEFSRGSFKNIKKQGIKIEIKITNSLDKIDFQIVAVEKIVTLSKLRKIDKHRLVCPDPKDTFVQAQIQGLIAANFERINFTSKNAERVIFTAKNYGEDLNTSLNNKLLKLSDLIKIRDEIYAIFKPYEKDSTHFMSDDDHQIQDRISEKIFPPIGDIKLENICYDNETLTFIDSNSFIFTFVSKNGPENAHIMSDPIKIKQQQIMGLAVVFYRLLNQLDNKTFALNENDFINISPLEVGSFKPDFLECTGLLSEELKQAYLEKLSLSDLFISVNKCLSYLERVGLDNTLYNFFKEKHYTDLEKTNDFLRNLSLLKNYISDEKIELKMLDLVLKCIENKENSLKKSFPRRKNGMVTTLKNVKEIIATAQYLILLSKRNALSAGK